MRILAIESTCDETGCAIVDDGRWVRSNIVASSAELHAIYKGVVPEIASRAQIENILPVVRQALEEADSDFNTIDAVAVANRPGLIGSLIVGVTAAKTLAWSLGKPLIGVDHVLAHLYSVNLSVAAEHVPPVSLPSIGLVCSGGHTAIYLVRDWNDIELLGKTIDDAVGEAYDKVAALLGLGYPGGPIVDRLAQHGDPQSIKFPRASLGKTSLNFSFSGLKTAVLYHVRGFEGREREVSSLNEQDIKNVCASFQAACVDVLVSKLKRAMKQTRAKSVIVGGGVSANSGLRAALSSLQTPVHLPDLQYCTDNAAMIGGLAHFLFQHGASSSLDLDASPVGLIR